MSLWAILLVGYVAGIPVVGLLMMALPSLKILSVGEVSPILPWWKRWGITTIRWALFPASSFLARFCSGNEEEDWNSSGEPEPPCSSLLLNLLDWAFSPSEGWEIFLYLAVSSVLWPARVVWNVIAFVILVMVAAAIVGIGGMMAKKGVSITAAA